MILVFPSLPHKLHVCPYHSEEQPLKTGIGSFTEGLIEDA